MTKNSYARNAVMLCMLTATCEAFSDPPNIANMQHTADISFAIIKQIFSQNLNHCFTKDAGGADECNYWQLGNSFDTVIDYLDKNPSESNAFTTALLNNYPILSSPKNTAGIACWYDDFGWWSVASERALQHPVLWTDDQKNQIERISRETWAYMQPGIQVWNLCKNSTECSKNFSSLEPKFDGGIWNYFWFSEFGKPYPNVCNSDKADPTIDTNPLTGRQNTVTNGLYANSALMRLKTTPKNEIYLQQSKSIHNFLTHWFVPTSNDTGLINYITPEAAVVRERVSTYKNEIKDPQYKKDLAWSADQGLILNEILIYMDSPLATAQEKTNLMLLAKQILLGSRLYFTNYTAKLDLADRLYSWSNSRDPSASMGLPPGQDYNDYNAGISVFLRSILSIYKSNSDLKNYLISLKYPDIITRMATNVISKTDGLCDPTLQCSNLVRTTNRLAILVTAIQMQDGVSENLK